VLLEQAGEISDLLLQGRDLSLQGAKLLRQREQRCRKLRDFAPHRGWWHLGKKSQTALMQAGQSLEVFRAHPLFAAIVWMAKSRKLRIRQPAAERFCIDAEEVSSLGH
jgi:hypothetical protein